MLRTAMGPTITGWLEDPAIVEIMAAVLSAGLCEDGRPDLTLLKGADYLGMILMAVCLGCLDYVLEDGTRWEWFSDGTIRMCAWSAAFAGASLVTRSLTYARPIVDLRAFASRNFTLSCWFSFVTGLGIFGLIISRHCSSVTSAGSLPGRLAAPSCGPDRFSWQRSPFTASLPIGSICACR
jgi:MFS transporter, DHA2 family, multidrug resistance protein